MDGYFQKRERRRRHLTAELQKITATPGAGFAESKPITFKDGDTFKNQDGQFVKLEQGVAGKTFSSTVKKCTLANATGVRLVFKGEAAPLPLSQYKPPEILEPGAVASFLVDKEPAGYKESNSFALNYNIQAFQGPFLGWKEVDTEQVTVTDSTTTAEIKSNVQVGPGATKYDSTISFEVTSNSDLVRIQVNQVIDQSPAA